MSNAISSVRITPTAYNLLNRLSGKLRGRSPVVEEALESWKNTSFGRNVQDAFATANRTKCAPSVSFGIPQRMTASLEIAGSAPRRNSVVRPRAARRHEQGEVRPVIIVSADAYNETRSPLVAIVPLTRAVAKNAVAHRAVYRRTGLESPSTA